MQEWRVAAFERLEIDGFILWGALLPTPLEDADPFEGQGSHGRLVCLAFSALRLLIDLCPEGMPGGFRSPLDKRLSQELWTLEAPVDPGLLAAAFRDRRDARIFLECVGGGQAFPWFAEGDEEAGSTNGPSTWHGVKHREVGMVLRALCDGIVEVGNGLQGDPELGDEGVPEEDMGAMTPSSVVSARALLMASMRVVMTSAERTWWARKKPSKVARLASCTALRVGQRRRKSQQSTVSFS
jgi:hypothetical protein